MANVESARSRWKPIWLLGLLAAVVLAGMVWQIVIFTDQERNVRRLKRDIGRTAQAVSALSVLVQSLERNLSALRAEVQAEAREPGRTVYMALRLRAIRAQAAQLPHGVVMLFGDSIVEALEMPEVCGLPTFNAAIGGVAKPVNKNETPGSRV